MLFGDACKQRPCSEHVRFVVVAEYAMEGGTEETGEFEPHEFAAPAARDAAEVMYEDQGAYYSDGEQVRRSVEKSL